MPTSVTHRSLIRLARGLTSGALALTVLGWSGSAPAISPLRAALAEDIDCYNEQDKDVYEGTECVERRATEAPRGPTTNPKDAVLRLEDTGKQATPIDSKEGSDKYGRWAEARFERDRSSGASTLGPNVMYSKVWVTKDLEAAKALFKEQAAIKSFPEREEKITGPVEKVNPTLFGEESSFVAMYYQDGDNKVWQHYRFVMRQATSVAVVYLFGRDELFVDKRDKGAWTHVGDWFTEKVFERM